MVEKDDWRLLNDVDDLRSIELNPTDGEDIFANAPHLKHCIFCLDLVNDDKFQFWYIPVNISCYICENCYRDFKDMFMWKILDGYDIDWKRE
ncbi:MAG: hypothetical protein K2I80_00085 [Ruminococcus sp.]|nr:hypothetical protein [Ruminococcus sp.]